MNILMALISILMINSVNLDQTKPVYNLQDGFNQHGSIMIIMEADSGKIIDANKSALNFYGYSKKELLSMSINQINKLSKNETEKERQLAKLEKRNFFLFKHKLKNGEIKDVEVYSYPIKDKNGNDLLFSIINDVTLKMENQRIIEQGRLAFILLLILLLGLSLFIIYITRESKKQIQNQKNSLQNLFDNMQEGFALYKVLYDENNVSFDCEIININKSFEKIVGIKQKDLVGKTRKMIFPTQDENLVKEYINIAKTGEPKTFLNYFSKLNKYFQISAYSPEVNQFATIILDITQIKNLEKMLEREKNLLQTTIQSIADGVISTGENSKIEIMNLAAENLTGWDKTLAKGKNIEEVFYLIEEKTNEHLKDFLKPVFENKKSIKIENHKILIKKDKTKIPIENSLAPIKDENGNVLGAVVIFRDFSEKKQKEEEILYLSYHDVLTGLYNRRFFIQEMKRLDTKRNLPFSLVLIDVNGLKLTNDAFGHIVGDELLKKVSNVLKKESRSDDIVSRIGGDEFVILLPKTSYEDTKIIINRIYDSISKETLENIIISVSIGCATKTLENQEIQEVFRIAEESMYERKIVETQEMRKETLRSIIRSLNKKYINYKRHSQNVADISCKIGEHLNLKNDELKQLRISALMHDIGKIAVDENSLEKHVEIGYQILKSIDDYSKLAEYILHHHEAWDSTGYPKQLKGDKIPLYSRIIAISDFFEKNGLEKTIKEKGKKLDPNLVDIIEKISLE